MSITKGKDGETQKKIDRIRSNPRNVSGEDIISVLLSLGYVEQGGSGSHRCFRHPQLPGGMLTIPRKIFTKVVKKVLVSIDLLMELNEDDI
ncbi:MAG: type II toxin-antitoxin system HicA family toxin [Anaerolineales bacterium]|nr:type II toxin-antitoxin system HicA family toxin [Anaerolineales bacterium]